MPSEMGRLRLVRPEGPDEAPEKSFEPAPSPMLNDASTRYGVSTDANRECVVPTGLRQAELTSDLPDDLATLACRLGEDADRLTSRYPASPIDFRVPGCAADLENGDSGFDGAKFAVPNRWRWSPTRLAACAVLLVAGLLGVRVVFQASQRGISGAGDQASNAQVAQRRGIEPSDPNVASIPTRYPALVERRSMSVSPRYPADLMPTDESESVSGELPEENAAVNPLSGLNGSEQEAVLDLLESQVASNPRVSI